VLSRRNSNVRSLALALGPKPALVDRLAARKLLVPTR
jgi:hypothetical protein